MRVRSGACLVCRHVRKTPDTSQSIRSFTSTARQRQDYVLSPLIIELDAADSKYVRRFEELDADEKRGMYGSEYLKQNSQVANPPFAVTEPVKSLSAQRTRKSPFNTCIVTPPDIMSFVLFGHSKGDMELSFLPMPRRRRRHLHSIYDHKNVQPYNQIQHNAQNLLYKFKSNNVSALQQAGFRPEKEAEIAYYISRRKDFANLRRTTSMISQTLQGRMFLVHRGASIVKGIKSCRRQNETLSISEEKYTQPEDILCYLNNLHANLSSQNRSIPMDIGPHICNAGLYYASKAFNLPAVRMYLQIATEKSYPMNVLTHWAMEHLCASLEKAEYSAYQGKWNSWRNDDWRRTDVLRLFTGWTSGGVPAKGETRQPCFATLIADNDGSYKQYVLALGRLGAADALWHEWKNPIRSEIDGKTSRGRTEIFVAAFLIAKDKSMALLVRDSFQASLPPKSLEKHPDTPQGFLGVGTTNALSRSITSGLVEELLKELDIEYANQENQSGAELGRKASAVAGG